MTLDLSDPELMVSHAKHHASLIRRNIIRWKNGDNLRLEKVGTPEKIVFAIRAVIDKEPNTTKWGLQFGDCIQNLRGALDHLLVCLAVDQIRGVKPGYIRGLQFPIADDVGRFEREVEKRSLDKLSSETLRIIERFQPYNRPHTHIKPLLAVLRELNNEIKHRVLIPTLAFPHTYRFNNMSGIPKGLKFIATPNVGDIKNGQIVFKITLPGPYPKFNYDFEYGFGFVVLHGQGLDDDSHYAHITELMNLLITETKSVINAFK